MRNRARSYSKGIVFVLTLFMGTPAFAETSATQMPKGGASVYSQSKAAKNEEAFHATLDLEVKAISYTESSNVDSNSQQQAQIGLDVKKQGTFFTESNIILGTFSEPHSFYYAAPEVYAGYGSQQSNVVVGRKLENLSFADSFFHLGLIQANSTNDNINFIEGGLTGISARYYNDSMGLLVNYMPIFLPNQGPQLKAEDGKIVSSNRWASSPPSKFKFGNEHKNINYAIRDYNIADIVSNSGFMLHGFIGQNKKTRPVFQFTYAKKPVNEIALSRDTYSDISNFEGYVFLTPIVLTHEVQAMDLNLDYENFSSTFSYLADQPQNIDAKNLEVMQNLMPLKVISFYASLDLSDNFHKKVDVYVATAVIAGGEIKDLNSEKKQSTFNVSTSRTLFKKPLRLGLKGEIFFIYNEALEADANMTYDQELKGSLLSLQFRYSPMKQMKVSLGADIIGVENALPSDQQGNFLDQNKANDRFFAGISYVF